MRDDAREQIGDAVADETFNQHIPPWEALSEKARADRVVLVREELLKILDRAGYVVVKKKESPDGRMADLDRD